LLGHIAPGAIFQTGRTGAAQVHEFGVGGNADSGVEVTAFTLAFNLLSTCQGRGHCQHAAYNQRRGNKYMLLQ